MANGRGGGRGRSRSRQLQVFTRGNVTTTLQGDSLVGALEELEKVVREKALRSAAFAMAKVFYNEMRARVPVDTGQLYGAIYHWHDDKRSGPNKQIYLTGPNKAKAPHWFNVEYGHWLYNRNSPNGWLKSKSDPNARGPGAHDLPGALEVRQWVPAKPYIGPTFDRAQDALRAGKVRLAERIQELL